MQSSLVQARRYNGCDSIVISGQHNRYRNYVLNLFEWIAENSLGSYGILYLRDDENSRRDFDYSNEFRVWTLRKGILTENSDPFLSPCIPTIEDPYDKHRKD
jgi:Immunity protein 7